MSPKIITASCSCGSAWDQLWLFTISSSHFAGICSVHGSHYGSPNSYYWASPIKSILMLLFSSSHSHRCSCQLLLGQSNTSKSCKINDCWHFLYKIYKKSFSLRIFPVMYWNLKARNYVFWSHRKSDFFILFYFFNNLVKVWLQRLTQLSCSDIKLYSAADGLDYKITLSSV